MRTHVPCIPYIKSFQGVYVTINLQAHAVSLLICTCTIADVTLKAFQSLENLMSIRHLQCCPELPANLGYNYICAPVGQVSRTDQKQ